MNPSVSTGGAQAALAARRAEETRRKLFASSAEIDAVSNSESAWMISAWAGGGSGSGSGPGSGHSQPADDQQASIRSVSQAGTLAGSQAASEAASQLSMQGLSMQDRPALPRSSSPDIDEVPRTHAAGKVSFWA